MGLWRLMAVASIGWMCAAANGADSLRVLDKEAPGDPRLTKVRSLYEGSGFKPKFATKEQWQERARSVREQVLMAAGLWPEPPKTPLNAVIHGAIDRGDYTVERVYFQSHPRFYVTGNLYRPKGKTGPFPAVLCPHGHWANGRLYECPQNEIEKQIAAGLEKEIDAAKYPLQARSANLAKLGCVVFFYDMIGYADNDPQRFPHRSIFTDADSHLWGISIFGLQTWNSIRSLDFVLSLPEVDKERIACTGASGGGTQTFVMMAIDDRLKVAAPVNMISHHNHQGGCICENADLLRIGTDNVEISATFAPRPFVHPTCTGDWTKEYLEKGLPETRAIYQLFGASQNVHAERVTADHNYNMHSREMMYTWFNRHLKLGHAEPIKEQKFVPVPPKELSVFDEAHPRPADSIDQAGLKKYLSENAKQQIEALRPKDGPSLGNYRQVVGTALRHMLASEMPSPGAVEVRKAGEAVGKGYKQEKLIIVAADSRQIPAVLMEPAAAKGPTTIVIHPGGMMGWFDDSGMAGPLANSLLAGGHRVLIPDLFLTGELSTAWPNDAAKKTEFYAGYNRTVLANRVDDILVAAAAMKKRNGGGEVNLIGVGKAGPWVMLARAAAGEGIARTVANADGFSFDPVKDINDENFLPHAKRLGGLYVLAGLAAPGELMIQNASEDGAMWLKDVYKAAGAEGKLRVGSAGDHDAVVRWMTRQ